MTRKDFKLIAAATAECLSLDLDPVERRLLVSLARRQCNYLRQTNPRFDRDKFLRASGLAENEL